MGNHRDRAAEQSQEHADGQQAPGARKNDMVRSRLRELRGQPLEKILKVLDEMGQIPIATYFLQLLVDELGHQVAGDVVDAQRAQTPKQEQPPQQAEAPAAPEPKKKERNKSEGDRGIIHQMSVHVHKHPKHISPSVGTLSRGDKIEILEAGPEWSKIRSGDIEGWINNSVYVQGTKSFELNTKPGSGGPSGFGDDDGGGAGRD